MAKRSQIGNGAGIAASDAGNLDSKHLKLRLELDRFGRVELLVQVLGGVTRRELHAAAPRIVKAADVLAAAQRLEMGEPQASREWMRHQRRPINERQRLYVSSYEDIAAFINGLFWLGVQTGDRAGATRILTNYVGMRPAVASQRMREAAEEYADAKATGEHVDGVTWPVSRGMIAAALRSRRQQSGGGLLAARPTQAVTRRQKPRKPNG